MISFHHGVSQKIFINSASGNPQAGAEWEAKLISAGGIAGARGGPVDLNIQTSRHFGNVFQRFQEQNVLTWAQS